MTSDPYPVAVCHRRSCPAPLPSTEQRFTVRKHYLLILSTGSLQSEAGVLGLYPSRHSLAPLLRFISLSFSFLFPPRHTPFIRQRVGGGENGRAWGR